MDLRDCLLILFLGVLLPCCRAVLQNCTIIDGKPPCVCMTPKGIIDLTPLQGNETSPTFTKITDSQGRIYSYNPCSTFTDGDCADAYICQKTPGDPQLREIADGGERIQGKNDSTFIVTYTSSSNDLVNAVEVDLVCEEGDDSTASTLVIDGDTSLGFFVFKLHSCVSCPGGCKETPAQLAGLIGLCLIIVAIVGVITYFVVGAIIMKVQYKATGSDLVPNKNFWVSLPSLVKDGCLLVASPCITLVKKRRDGYSAM